MAVTTEGEVMTPDQIADYLQISRRSVYNLAQAGQIPAVKVGDQWRFFRPEIDRWLTRMSRQHVGDPTPVEEGSHSNAM